MVDASVALAWCLTDESSVFAYSILDRIADEGAAVPAHWPLEVANGLLVAERRGRVSADDFADANRLLGGLKIEIVPIELYTATGTVIESARKHRLSTYDAAYLDLARFRGAALATLDQPLQEACRAAGVNLVE